MMYIILLAALCNYAITTTYQTFPAFERIREWIKSRLHEKLVSCTFCAGFWLSPITLIIFDMFNFSTITLGLMFALATTNILIDSIIYKLTK